MPNCTNCGTDLEGNEKFCHNCGQSQEEQPSAGSSSKKKLEKAGAVQTGSDELKSGSRNKAVKLKLIAIISLVGLFLIGAVIFAVINLVDGTKITSPLVDDEIIDTVDEEAENDFAVIVEGTHTIVGLFPVTGPLKTFGENSSEVAKLATADINKWLEEEGKRWRLNLEIADTETSAYEGQRKMQHWLNEGVKFFAGPMASLVADECLPFANANSILFISPSSTTPTLAIADDWFFRFCTDDSIQGLAIAEVAAKLGLSHLIIARRNDLWGDGLAEAVIKSCQKRGITVTDNYNILYDPTQRSFSREVKLLESYLVELEDMGVDLGKVGFCLIAFDEATYFLQEAANYSHLSQVAWIGSDGTALSEYLMNNNEAKRFAAKVKFINPMYRFSEPIANSAYEHVSNHIRSTFNRECDIYSYNTYDIIWALAIAIDEVGYDPKSVREILPRVTDQWSSDNGASGHIVLNEYGDRAYADFDYWLVNRDLQWESVGFYQGSADTVFWLRRVF